MKRLIVVLSVAFGLVACSGEETNNLESENNEGNSSDKLIQENQYLKKELADRDSTINSYFMFVNEIRQNLDLINKEQGVILNLQGNPEVINVDNIDLIEELKVLGALMSDNENKIARLKSELKNADIQMGQFEEMIISLTEEVEMKNMEIFQLHQELENLDGAFSELFDAFEQQAEELDSVKDEMNTAFFTFGSKEELIENGVITKEGGFVGIGKISKLKDDFNQSYFTEIKINELKEIPLGVKKVEVITTHPNDSYKVVGEEPIEKIVIVDAENFWSASKYLVIVVK